MRATSVGTGFNPAGVSTGSTTSGGLYSFGSSASTDRALGSIGSTSAGNFYWGVKLVNNTSTTITGFTVSYAGEQWRNSAAAAQATTFSYGLGTTDLRNGSYQTVTTLGFTSPITGGAVGALNGNATANRTVVGPVTVSNINWAPGAVLWLRFYDMDHPGNDHGLAIDDFSFQAASSQSSAYDPPAGYYNAATGLTGTNLQSALHNIITPHTVIPYTGGSDVWAALKVLDEDPSDSTKLKLTYSATSILKTDTTWDREHLWPQSRGVSGSGPDYSDLFDLRPAYTSVNSARGNKFYDISTPADANYHIPATTGAAADTSSDSDSWQPSANERGDIARSMFYMDVRYDGNDSGTVDLVLENQINTSADMAVLSTLVAWSNADPVSEEERKRNSTIYTTYQHNRNPFVDHPEYVDSIYGDFVRLSGDTDLDGMPNAWETAQSFNPSNPMDAVQDADGDGFSNFEEYWMGSNPHNLPGAPDPITLIVNGNYTGSVEDGSVAHPFKTINAAVAVVPSNERRAILVKPSSNPYSPVYITGKNNIFIFSEQGADQTIIDATETGGSAVRMYDFQRAAFVGFTVRNANTSWYGAGMRVDAPSGSILIAENKFTGNTTSSTSDGGGGLYLKTANSSRVINNFLTGNTGVRGGGVLFGGGDAEFWFNTIAGNSATGGSGGGLSALQGVHPDVRDNIIWANSGGSTTAQIHQITGLTKNILQGAASGSGNIGSDPLFVGSGDYHLSANSPAKNAAIALPNGKDFDLDPRPDSSGGQKDIGADERVDSNSLPETWRQQIVDFNPSDAITAISQVLPGDDFDHDGLTNIQEYQQGFNPANPDTDGDGIGDKQEKIAGTNPNDAGSVTQKRIAYFPFDSPTFTGAEGQLPQSVSGTTPARSVTGFSGNAMHIHQLNQVLSYGWVRPDGSPNFSVKRGTIRMWFKLDWTPTSGAMSGYWSRLFDLGAFGFSEFVLHFNNSDPIFQFYEADQTAGHSFTTWSTFSDRGVTSGQWHQVAVTYSPAGQKIYLDGTQISSSQTWIDGLPVAENAANWTYPPKLIDFINLGLKFGSDGGQPLRGAIDDAEFFNYELSASQIAQDFGASDSDQDGLSDAWEISKFGSLTHNPSTDTDGDGVSDIDEIHAGTNWNDFFNGSAPVLKIVSGNGQTDLAGATLALPLVVQVSNANQAPAKTGTVTFSITSLTGGSLTSSGVAPVDPQGRSQTSLTLPVDPSSIGPAVTVKAIVSNNVGSSEVTFSAQVVSMPFTLGQLNTSGTGSAIELSWAHPGVSLLYVIKRFDPATGSWITIGTSPTTNFTDGGGEIAARGSNSGPSSTLKKGVIYLYKVVATGAGKNVETVVQGAVINPEENDDSDEMTNGDEVDAGYYSKELADGTLSAGTIKLGNNPAGWVGPDPKLADTDSDGTNDDVDGWANNSFIAPARLARVQYAVIQLDKLGFPPYLEKLEDGDTRVVYPYQLNDSMQIVAGSRGNNADITYFWDVKTQESTELETLGFSASIGGTPWGKPRILDNAGKVCGSGDNGSKYAHGFTWKKGEDPKVLPDYIFPYISATDHPNYISYVTATNNSGTKMVGNVDAGGTIYHPTDGGIEHRDESAALIWGSPDLIGESVTENWGYPPTEEHKQGLYFYPTNVNNNGIVVGHYYHWTASNHGAISDSGGMAIYDSIFHEFETWNINISSDNRTQISCIDNDPVHPRAFGCFNEFELYFWQKEGSTWVGHNLTAGLYGEVLNVNDRFEVLTWDSLLQNGKSVPMDTCVGNSWNGVYVSDINNKGVAVGTASKTNELDAQGDPTRHSVLLVPCDIVPDVNRDGLIDNKDQGRITNDKPWKFWVNDDDDSGTEGGSDIPKAAGGNGYDLPVNGIRDLVDFFPVWLDIKQLVDVLPPAQYDYVLESDDYALQYVETDLLPSDTKKGLTGALGAPSVKDNPNGLGLTSAKAIYQQQGKLTPAFLQGIKDGTKGVILVEAFKATDKPLKLVVRKGGDPIATIELPLKMVKVNTMFRHLNLMSANGQSGGWPTNMGEPENLKDNETNGKYFVFVHGYNVDAEQAKGWNSEVFKRLWWSGSKARFVGVTWYGSETKGDLPGLPDVTPDYQTNVTNAFATAPDLKNGLSQLQGDITIAAHSLGNMVVGSAMEDWGLSVKHYFMVDAAVAMEAYDASIEHAGMEHQEWTGYQHRLWASNWYQLPWATGDWRKRLTWKDRLHGVSNAFNLYSSGEEVLINPSGNAFIPFGAEAVWVNQERLKGRNVAGGSWILTSNEGGWKFNAAYVTPNGTIMPNDVASQLSDATLKTAPFFDPNPAQMLGENGSSYVSPPNQRNDVLAKNIPALSHAAGSNSLSRFPGMDINSSAVKVNGWPRSSNRWFHSDLRNMSYTYTFKVFDKMVEVGELK